MTKQVKRENIIRALENCNAPEKCRDCPWDECEKPDCKHSDYPDGLIAHAIALLKAQESCWISVEDGLPQEHDTIFAKLYGTDKWRNGMFLKMSDDVRVVKVFRDGTKRVHHDHTVDGRWESERKGIDVYGHVTHWMPNPELPFCTSRPTDE